MTHSEDKQDYEKLTRADKANEFQSSGFWHLVTVGMQTFN